MRLLARHRDSGYRESDGQHLQQVIPSGWCYIDVALRRAEGRRQSSPLGVDCNGDVVQGKLPASSLEKPIPIMPRCRRQIKLFRPLAHPRSWGSTCSLLLKQPRNLLLKILSADESNMLERNLAGSINKDCLWKGLHATVSRRQAIVPEHNRETDVPGSDEGAD
jgi:hypothetical protein